MIDAAEMQEYQLPNHKLSTLCCEYGYLSQLKKNNPTLHQTRHPPDYNHRTEIIHLNDWCSYVFFACVLASKLGFV